MGKKNKKSRKQESDPIVKQIRKKKPIHKQPEEEEEFEEEQEIENSEQEQYEHVIDFKKNDEKPSFYKALLDKLKVKNSQPQESSAQNQQISAKLQIKQSKTSIYSKVKKYQLETVKNDNPASHFDHDYNEIRKQICENNIELEQQEVLTSFFKEKTATLTQTLNNGVEFKQFNLKQSLKNKLLIDINCREEDYHIEQLSQQYLIKGTKFLLPVVDEVENPQNGLIKSYYDYIMTDPEEEQAPKFRQTYVSHIIKHLQSPRQTFGFTRCKVLILTAFKGDAISIIEELIKGDYEIVNKERFEREFCDEERLEEDDFRIGIQFSRKGYIKLHADFEKSDIIVSSTLGMRLIIGAEGSPNREIHFLSSIEILVIDRASSIYMQNWTYLEDILQVTNRLPNHKNITSDLNLIRPYCFENMAKFYRQNIIYTDHYFQELNFIRKQYFTNYKGCFSNKVYHNPIFLKSDHFQQEFRQLDCTYAEQQIELRLAAFKKLWNDVENKWSKTLIFVQSYFDFVTLRGHFKRINSTCECVSEYTKRSKVQSTISKFKDGRINFIMITERAYYFEIIQLRQMKNIIFYQLPQHSIIYKNIVSSVENLGTKTQIITYYSKFDAYQLETIVGTQIAEEMLSEQNKRTTFIL